mmetsp:Transcript_27188/g.56621  ORF Transcript_27188/g.56621 Transcript_27188/m.56621 type:complete len:206 (-) Transcript_27188:242-859(-)
MASELRRCDSSNTPLSRHNRRSPRIRTHHIVAPVFGEGETNGFGSQRHLRRRCQAVRTTGIALLLRCGKTTKYAVVGPSGRRLRDFPGRTRLEISERGRRRRRHNQRCRREFPRIGFHHPISRNFLFLRNVRLRRIAPRLGFAPGNDSRRRRERLARRGRRIAHGVSVAGKELVPRRPRSWQKDVRRSSLDSLARGWILEHVEEG